MEIAIEIATYIKDNDINNCFSLIRDKFMKYYVREFWILFNDLDHIINKLKHIHNIDYVCEYCGRPFRTKDEKDNHYRKFVDNYNKLMESDDWSYCCNCGNTIVSRSFCCYEYPIEYSGSICRTCGEKYKNYVSIQEFI